MARSRTRLAIPLGHTWNDCLQEHPALTDSLERLPKPTFVRAGCAIACLHPGLHPDGYESADSGWPGVLRRFAADAWRRADAGELTANELYCHQAGKARYRSDQFASSSERHVGMARTDSLERLMR